MDKSGSGAYQILGENVPGTGHTLRGLADPLAQCRGRAHGLGRTQAEQVTAQAYLEFIRR